MTINHRSTRFTRSKTPQTTWESSNPVIDLQDPLLEASNMFHNKRHRSATSDNLIELQAQAAALCKMEREDEIAELRKKIAKLKRKRKTSTIDDEGKDP